MKHCMFNWRIYDVNPRDVIPHFNCAAVREFPQLLCLEVSWGNSQTILFLNIRIPSIIWIFWRLVNYHQIFSLNKSCMDWMLGFLSPKSATSPFFEISWRFFPPRCWRIMICEVCEVRKIVAQLLVFFSRHSFGLWIPWKSKSSKSPFSF